MLYPSFNCTCPPPIPHPPAPTPQTLIITRNSTCVRTSVHGVGEGKGSPSCSVAPPVATCAYRHTGLISLHNSWAVHMKEQADLGNELLSRLEADLVIVLISPRPQLELLQVLPAAASPFTPLHTHAVPASTWPHLLVLILSTAF